LRLDRFPGRHQLSVAGAGDPDVAAVRQLQKLARPIVGRNEVTSPSPRNPGTLAICSGVGLPHPPELHRELIAPDASVDRGSSLVSTMIPVGSWPRHGSSYLQTIVSPARALLRGGFGGSGRRSSPRASRRRASDRTPRAVGLFRDSMLAVRPGSRTGTFRGQPARATRRRVSSRWRECHRSPSHHHQRVKNRDNAALSAARLSAHGLCVACLSRWPGCLAVLFSCAGQFSSDWCGSYQGRPWR
jgi:hypothetical protein